MITSRPALLLAALAAALLLSPACRREAASSREVVVPPREGSLPAGEAGTPGQGAGRSDRGVFLLNRGVKFLADGQNEEAVQVLELARQADPSSARIGVELGRAYMRGGKIDDARKILADLLASPGTPADEKIRARELVVEILLGQGDLAGAKKACAPLLEGGSVTANSHRLAGQIAGREGDGKKALAELNEAARLAPADPEIRTALGVALLQEGDISGAETALEEATRLDPNSEAALNSLAKVYEREGRSADAEKARKHFQEIYDRKAVRQKVGPLQSKGVDAYNAGKLDEALQSFQEILKISPRDPQALAQIGSVYLAMQKLDEAEKSLKEALEVRPDDSFALTEMGRVRALKNDLPGAVDLLQRAVRINPDAPEPHYFLAGIYYAQQRKDDFVREKAAFERLRKTTPVSGVMELPEEPAP